LKINRPGKIPADGERGSGLERSAKSLGIPVRIRRRPGSRGGTDVDQEAGPWWAFPSFYTDAGLVPYGRFSSTDPVDTKIKTKSYDISGSHPIDRSLKRVFRARSVVEAQYQDAVRIRIDGLYSAYVDVQEARERVHSSAANLAQWDQLLKETRRRAKQGIVTDGDVGQIESAQQLADLRPREAKSPLVRTRRALGSLPALNTTVVVRLFP
jgi:cobalt-zinc-cadmium efflux system outer membrane protein